MPPIKIQSEAPINEQTSQPTPTTASPQAGPQASNQYTPAGPLTSDTPSAASAYVPPRPGAAAVPAPTAAVQPPPPTKTVQQESVQASVSAQPPPPQPGAVPVPQNISSGVFGNGAASAASGQLPSHLPLPPQPRQTPSTAANAYAPESPFAAATAAAPAPASVTAPTSTQQSMPPQFSYAPPSANAAPTHTTDTSHPPGYRQNPYAGDMTPAQRSAVMAGEQSNSNAGGAAVLDGITEWFGGVTAGTSAAATTTTGASGAGNSNLSSDGALGIKPLDGAAADSGEAVGAAWEGAKRWVGDAARKLGEVESEVWKRVNKD